MAILKTRCPECNAPLKSSAGFTVGQTVCCPKCETYFAVEAPEEETDASEEEESPKRATAARGKTKDASTTKKRLKAAAAEDEDDEDEKPKKKKKKRDYDEDEETSRSYKNSPLRYAVLGVLVVVMLVLGYMLYDKRKKERESESGGGNSSSGGEGKVISGPRTPFGPGQPPINGQPIGGDPPLIAGPGVKIDGKKPNGTPVGGGAPGPFGVLGGGPAPGSPEALKLAQAQMQKLKTALVGTWTADLGDGATEELTYTATGTFTEKLTGPDAATASGKYTVKQLVGTKGLKIQLDTAAGPKTVTVIFEDDELQHPTLLPGVTGTFRKK